MQPSHSERILIVNAANRRHALRRSLRARGIAVSFAGGVRRAFNQLTRAAFDVVAIDLVSIPDAFDFIKQIRSTAIFKTTRIVVVGEWGTGQPSLALSLRADAYEPAPVDAVRLLQSIERLPHRRATAAGRNQ